MMTYHIQGRLVCQPCYHRSGHDKTCLPLFDLMAYAQPFPRAAHQAKAVQPSFGPDLAVRLICPECRDPNPNIVEEFGSGDLVCGNCGLVLGDRIVDTRSEWRVSNLSFLTLL